MSPVARKSSVTSCGMPSVVAVHKGRHESLAALRRRPARPRGSTGESPQTPARPARAGTAATGGPRTVSTPASWSSSAGASRPRDAQAAAERHVGPVGIAEHQDRHPRVVHQAATADPVDAPAEHDVRREAAVAQHRIRRDRELRVDDRRLLCELRHRAGPHCVRAQSRPGRHAAAHQQAGHRHPDRTTARGGRRPDRAPPALPGRSRPGRETQRDQASSPGCGREQRHPQVRRTRLSRVVEGRHGLRS